MLFVKNLILKFGRVSEALLISLGDIFFILFLYPIFCYHLKSKGVDQVYPYNFKRWHLSNRYFKGNCRNNGVFIKFSKSLYIENEVEVYKRLGNKSNYLPGYKFCSSIFGFCYIVVEDLTPSFLDNFSKEELTDEMVRDIETSLFNVIDELQEKNIIHRDITTSNVHYDNGNLKLIDFSLAVYDGAFYEQPYIFISKQVENAIGGKARKTRDYDTYDDRKSVNFILKELKEKMGEQKEGEKFHDL